MEFKPACGLKILLFFQAADVAEHNDARWVAPWLGLVAALVTNYRDNDPMAVWNAVGPQVERSMTRLQSLAMPRLEGQPAQPELEGAFERCNAV